MTSFLQSIGEYQILEKLGRGGMADVYLAFDSKNNRRVALKLIECGAGEEAREIVAAERLGAELQAQLCLIEARVPKIHSSGDRDGFFCIDMEYVEGRDLSEIICLEPLEPQVAAGIAREICSILRNAHSISLHVDGREFRAIVHGDIKPKNVRIDAQGGVRVLDFGIAKGLSLTRKLTSNIFGSVAYSSPERLETGRIDEMSDLWSVGVVLYEMIAGRLPFEAPSTERLETIVRSHTPPLPLGNTCPVGSRADHLQGTRAIAWAQVPECRAVRIRPDGVSCRRAHAGAAGVGRNPPDRPGLGRGDQAHLALAGHFFGSARPNGSGPGAGPVEGESRRTGQASVAPPFLENSPDCHPSPCRRSWAVAGRGISRRSPIEARLFATRRR